MQAHAASTAPQPGTWVTSRMPGMGHPVGDRVPAGRCQPAAVALEEGDEVGRCTGESAGAWQDARLQEMHGCRHMKCIPLISSSRNAAAAGCRHACACFSSASVSNRQFSEGAQPVCFLTQRKLHWSRQIGWRGMHAAGSIALAMQMSPRTMWRVFVALRCRAFVY